MVCKEVLFGYKNLWLSRSFLENYGICCCLPGRSCFAYLFCSLVWCHPHWPIIIWGEMGPFYLGGALLRCLVIGFWSVLCGWCATQHCLSHWKTCSLSWDKHCFLFLKMGVVPSLCKILRSLGSKQYQELCAVVWLPSSGKQRTCGQLWTVNSNVAWTFVAGGFALWFSSSVNESRISCSCVK